MKTVVNIGIGGRCYTIDEDAYQKLNAYLDAFRSKTGSGYQTKEIMDEVEGRISELFADSLSTSHKDVIDLAAVLDVISRIGMPDGSDTGSASFRSENSQTEKPVKKFYRDPSDKKIGGVCSGLAAYTDVDVTLIRIIFLVALICGTAGFWIYLIFWIIAPEARTAAQKCEMHGMAATAENMKSFTTSRK